MRSFAIIPAAGRSQRMGQPKLLLPWEQWTVIEQVLAAWKDSRVSAVVVTVHPGDDELIARCRAAGVDVAVVDPPPADMKASVAAGLAYAAANYHPLPSDVWLLAPADMPRLSARLIDQVLGAHDPADPRVLVPRAGDYRGHPVLFPWPLASEVDGLAEDAGINALVAAAGPREIDCDDVAAFADLDTPDDYERSKGGGRES
ncbi:MAG TPA: nucleotidyltransferase family protein [Pirellulales bacterium]|nr:nucleotidyltransferase family protein [Pirellulales bacterium]